MMTSLLTHPPRAVERKIPAWPNVRFRFIADLPTACSIAHMMIFALGILVPLVAYCLIQTVRDFRSQDFLLAAWGVCMTGFVLFGIAQALRNPGY